MECHYHVGRAAVFQKDCTMRNLEAVKGKEAAEAVELWEALVDHPLNSLPVFSYQHVGESDVRVSPPCSAQEGGGLRVGPDFVDDEEFASGWETCPTPVEEGYITPEFVALLEARPTRVEEEFYTPEFSTIPECGESPDLSDEEFDDGDFSTTSSVPSLEEKKLASIPESFEEEEFPEEFVEDRLKVLREECDRYLTACAYRRLLTPAVHAPPEHQVMPDAPPPSLELDAPPVNLSGPWEVAPSAPALEAPPDDSPRLEKYVVFSSHSVQGRRKANSLFTRCMIKVRIASKREVILDNEEAGYVTSNVLSLAQKQIEVVKYFWQGWHDKSPQVTQDCISLFAGTFTHADYADVYADLAEFILTNPVFTKTQTKLLDAGCTLRDTVVLRVQQLIADHPDHAVFSSRQRVLSDTITFVNNQLLLRGLIDEARKPRQIAPAIVDFRKEAVSKTSLSPARHSRFAARQPLLTRSTRSTVVSVW